MEPLIEVTEQKRLNEAREAHIPWKKWGPYLSERQWGTVREDYSHDGNAWDYFTHDQARSRAYRWGEDGLGGLCDDKQRLCFALALWNERDPILKERLFGLTNSQGNHGEDVKEYYFYLDSTPTHSYMKYLYKYPQREYPYADLVETNRRRSREEFEYELLDTGVFDDDRYFDVFVEYAKAGAGRHPHQHHRAQSRSGSRAASRAADAVVPEHVVLGRARRRSPRCASQRRVSSTSRTTSSASTACPATAPRSCSSPRTRATPAVSGASPMPRPTSRTPSTRYVVSGHRDAVNPDKVGTKAAAHYALEVPGGGSQTVRLRLRRDAAGRRVRRVRARHSRSASPTPTSSTTRITPESLGEDRAPRPPPGAGRACSGPSSSTSSTSSAG